MFNNPLRMPLCLIVGYLAIGLLNSSLVAAPDETAGAKPDQTLFETEAVWTIRLTIPATEFDAMQPRGGGGGFPGFGRPAPLPKNTDNTEREVHRNNFGMDLPTAKGSVEIAGQQFPEVQLRYKGNGTIGDASGTIKKSIKIDIDHYQNTARFQGHKTLNLHCGVADPSKCRESLGYFLYRAAGVPAPRTALAEVWLTVPGKYDNELLGVYTIVEQVDKAFLQSNFGSDKGLLLKPEGVREFEDKGDEWKQYAPQYKPKRDPTSEESERMIAFARLVQKADDEQFQREIGAFLDLDAYLKFLAVTAFVSNSDSYFVLGHNYYIYLHPSGQLHFMPWDLDRAFANFPILGTNPQQMNLSFLHPYSGTHRMTERILALPGIKDRYLELLRELSTTCFNRETILSHLRSTEQVVNELLEKEKKLNRPQPPSMFGKPPLLETFIEKRCESLAAQAAGTTAGHIPTSGFGPGDFKIGNLMAPPLMESLDVDKDGFLSHAEWISLAMDVFDKCRKDEDDSVDDLEIATTLNDLFPKPPEGQPAPPRMGAFFAGPIVQRADQDKNAKVTKQELLAAADKLFAEFDSQKQGKLEESAFSDLLTALFPAPKPPAGPNGAGGPNTPPGPPRGPLGPREEAK